MSLEHLESVERSGTVARREYPHDATIFQFVRTRVRTYRLMLNDM